MEAISPTSSTLYPYEVALRDHHEIINKNRHISSSREISSHSRFIRRALAMQLSPRDKPPNKWRVQAPPVICFLLATDRRRRRIISLACRRFRAVKRLGTMQWRRSKGTDSELSSLPTSVIHHKKTQIILVAMEVVCLHLPTTEEASPHNMETATANNK